jgi:undecaprenyl diphosphate synthase
MAVPESVAIIMDGNGRWARSLGKPRTYGHKVGAENVEKICRAADALGIKYLTIYAFSTENWKRPESEVSTLMSLIKTYLNRCIKTCKRDNMRFRIIGDRSGLSKELQDLIVKLEDVSSIYTGLTLVIAINYGSRDEMRRAFIKTGNKFLSEGKSLDEIKEKDISDNLDTADIPDPDLLIRTSGEERLSNFLMWQLSYSEFIFTDKAWPEFSGEELEKCIREFESRNRRFGGI